MLLFVHYKDIQFSIFVQIIRDLMHKYKKDNRLMQFCYTFFCDKKDIYNIITTFVPVK